MICFPSFHLLPRDASTVWTRIPIGESQDDKDGFDYYRDDYHITCFSSFILLVRFMFSSCSVHVRFMFGSCSYYLVPTREDRSSRQLSGVPDARDLFPIRDFGGFGRAWWWSLSLVWIEMDNQQLVSFRLFFFGGGKPKSGLAVVVAALEFGVICMLNYLKIVNLTISSSVLSS